MRRGEKKKRCGGKNVRRDAFSLALEHKEGRGNSKDNGDDDKVLVVGIGGREQEQEARRGEERKKLVEIIRSKPRC